MSRIFLFVEKNIVWFSSPEVWTISSLLCVNWHLASGPPLRENASTESLYLFVACSIFPSSSLNTASFSVNTSLTSFILSLWLRLVSSISSMSLLISSRCCWAWTRLVAACSERFSISIASSSACFRLRLALSNCSTVDLAWRYTKTNQYKPQGKLTGKILKWFLRLNKELLRVGFEPTTSGLTCGRALAL